MKSKTDRGVLFIANMIDFKNPKIRRNGADADTDSLIHTFHNFGFKIFPYRNLDQEKFFKELRKLIQSNYAKDTECFVMVLMTHGDGIDRVQFSDSSYCLVDEITNLFQSDNCPNLINKPKVLIYPFCRGSHPDRGYNLGNNAQASSSSRIEQDGIATLPKARFNNVSTLSDVLVCYATTPGYETHRDTDKGSWYIQNLCDVLAERAHNTAMEDIIKCTDSRVRQLRSPEGTMQTGSFKNLGFNKKLFFNPGFPSDTNLS